MMTHWQIFYRLFFLPIVFFYIAATLIFDRSISYENQLTLAVVAVIVGICHVRLIFYAKIYDSEEV